MHEARPDRDRGVYGISIAAELVGMGTQTLRLYESRGLLQPSRSDGGTRRYSDDDLDRLRRIGQLIDDGLNLAGIALVLGLEAENASLRAAELDRRSVSSPGSTPRRPSSRKRSGGLGSQPARER